MELKGLTRKCLSCHRILIMLRMDSLYTLFLCSVGHQSRL